MSKRKNIIVMLIIASVIGLFSAIVFTSSANDVNFTPKASVTMADNLIFNIYVPKDERLSEISFDGEVKNISDLSEKDGYYHVKMPLDPCFADREINMSVVLEENGEKTNISCQFSIIKYAGMLLSSDESETAKKLVKDILAYINSAKAFFGNESSESIESLLGDYEAQFSPVAAENTTNGIKAATFVLGATPAVRFYIEDGYSASDFIFTNGEKTLNFKTGSNELGGYMEISMNAYAMLNTFSYTVKGSDTVGKYNLASYCDYVINTYAEPDKELVVDLAKKFYIYCESAAAYRRQVIISLCDHEYTSYVEEKATATKEGIMEYNCSKCGHSYTERIPTTLKILAIGNSFSIDAMEHLYIVCKDAGIENVVLGNLWKSSCDLKTHLSSMQNNNAAYTFALSSDESQGMVNMTGSKTALYGITYTDWDFITIQQRSALTGIADSYSYLDDVISYINANKNADTKLLWHMTWAYQDSYTSNTFAEYDNDQMTMYNAIISCTQNNVLIKNDIVGVIPSGTSIQNLRTSHLGDTLNRDGVHLSEGIGRYTAALTYLAAVTGYDISSIDAVPSSYPDIAEHLDCIKDAVKKALAKPFEVTESAYPKEEKPINPNLSELTDEDKEFLRANGYDPDKYMLLNLTITENAYYDSTSSSNPFIRAEGHSLYYIYLTTQIFTKEELVNGTLIRVDEGYQYRPVGWEDYPSKSTIKKPGNVTEMLTVINDAWWGSYTHRAFNISSIISKQKIYLEERVNFRIYVPIDAV